MQHSLSPMIAGGGAVMRNQRRRLMSRSRHRL